MKTQRLYENDAYCREFTARVVSCDPAENGFAVVLDKTAFFPEGGGQAADTGALNGVAVRDVQLRGDTVIHITAAPLPVGETVTGAIDWEQRFARMQKHTGEHIVSGLIWRRYGLHNVGFHLGSEDVTLDLDGELTRQQLDEIETLANRAVWENRAVRAWFPTPQEQETLEYRSKKAVEGPLRIVEIEGIDRCACCAPHVAHTGEIGAIRLLEFLRYKGGIRMHMQCGLDALLDSRMHFHEVTAAAARLSVKPTELTGAVERLLAQRDELSRQLRLERSRAAAAYAQTAALDEASPLFLPGEPDNAVMRQVLEILLARGVCPAGVFVGEDTGGYRFAAMGGDDLPGIARRMKEQLNSRGGGSKEIIQGQVTAPAAEIRAFWRRETGRLPE
mgnify:FL=1